LQSTTVGLHVYQLREALALREPWRRLFTEAELKKARQRLDQLNYKSEL
jgi:hypothetical protein